MPGIADQVPISGVEDCKAAPVRKSAAQQQDQVTKCMQMHGERRLVLRHGDTSWCRQALRGAAHMGRVAVMAMQRKP